MSVAQALSTVAIRTSEALHLSDKSGKCSFTHSLNRFWSDLLPEQTVIASWLHACIAAAYSAEAGSSKSRTNARTKDAVFIL
jgi:hypothetical protein